ncbi:MAG: prenyltransferase/squalene oxidase repeat-containing protein [Planctomycetota bacterium]|nr:prenyltransferase/squalene oxidase repeat-containing protein [Planctomycetota bacterium]
MPDAGKREVLRGKLRQFLARSREADGSWNDRQFGRSGGYGTALALMVLHMAHLPKPSTWASQTEGGRPKK